MSRCKVCLCGKEESKIAEMKKNSIKKRIKQMPKNRKMCRFFFLFGETSLSLIYMIGVWMSARIRVNDKTHALLRNVHACERLKICALLCNMQACKRLKIRSLSCNLHAREQKESVHFCAMCMHVNDKNPFTFVQFACV